MWNSGVDISQALQIPGVVEVIMASDIPGKKVRSQSNYIEELLAESEVSFTCTSKINVYVYIRPQYGSILAKKNPIYCHHI